MLLRNSLEKDEGLTYLDHRGGGLVIFGSSVLVDGHGDELYCLSIHFGRHVVVLLVQGKNEIEIKKS